MNNSEIKDIIEALLFAVPEPLTQKKVNNVFDPETPNLNDVVDALNTTLSDCGVLVIPFTTIVTIFPPRFAIF